MMMVMMVMVMVIVMVMVVMMMVMVKYQLRHYCLLSVFFLPQSLGHQTSDKEGAQLCQSIVSASR